MLHEKLSQEVLSESLNVSSLRDTSDRDKIKPHANYASTDDQMNN